MKLFTIGLATALLIALLATSIPLAGKAEASLPEPTGCSSASDPIPTSTIRRPVVYVHGWVGRAKQMTLASAALQTELGDEYAVYRFDYAALATSWPVGNKAADCLAHYLLMAARSYTGTPGGVLAVGHSMGGIALRAAAKTLTDSGDADALIGIVTIATPHKGTPMGGTAAADIWQNINEMTSVLTNNAEHAPILAGTDAARCLGINSGCALPPYIEGDQRIATIGTQITLERQLFSMTWSLQNPRVTVFGDGIVPLESAIGYFDSGPGPYTTSQAFGSDTFACLESQGEMLSAASTALGAGIFHDTFSAITDLAADRSFKTGHYALIQAPYTLASLASRCSHINLLTEPRVVASTVSYLRDMERAAGRTVEERDLDRRRWLYEVTTPAPDGTGGPTDARFGTGHEEHDNSTSQALGCSADAPIIHEYALDGLYESLSGTIGNRLGSDPTLTSHWTIDADGTTTSFDLTGRATRSTVLDLSGVQKLIISTFATGPGCTTTTPIGILGNTYVVEVRTIIPGSSSDATPDDSQGLAAAHGWPTGRHDSNPAFYIWLGAASAWGTVKMGMVTWLACDSNNTCVAGREDDVLITALGTGGRVVIAEFTATEPAVDTLTSLNATEQELQELLRNEP